MGNLTDDMTRLRGEVDALRNDRGALMLALSHGVKDLASSVSTLRTDFGASHAAMAKRSRKHLSTYVSGISKRITRMRHANAADLAGASKAWAGKKK
jgi:hypothetical protein